MRNLVLLQDSVYSSFVDGIEEEGSDIVSISLDIGSNSIFALTQNGFLYTLQMADHLRVETKISLCSEGVIDNSWFNATVVAEVGAVVCISHSGMIVSVREDPTTGRQSDIFEVEGDVDGGIATACWNPESSNILIITNNDSILLMTCYWDVLEEVPLPSREQNSPCSVSFRGDGEFLTILTVDSDSIPHVRVYSKNLELISVGKNIADGPSGILKGLGSAVAYATNGSLIALSQQKTKTKQQIVFIEKNGLRHLEFDIQCPPLVDPISDWKVSTLHWDLPSTLLAVGLTAVNSAGVSVGAVQLYYRGNYHWYLKQQWVAYSLMCLGFDTETVGRLFMVQSSRKVTNTDSNNSSNSSNGNNSGMSSRNALRVVDLSWDVCASGTSDGTIAVIDGPTLLLTPLAINTAPPPMSAYKHTLNNPVRHAFFWPRVANNGGGNGVENGGSNGVGNGLQNGGGNVPLGWGLACLCEDGDVHLITSNPKGEPVGCVSVGVKSALSLIDKEDCGVLVLRGVAATEVFDSKGDDTGYNMGDNMGEGRGVVGEVTGGVGGVVSVVLYGSRERAKDSYSSYSDGEVDEGAGGQPDELLTLSVRLSDGVILNAELSSNLHMLRSNNKNHTTSSNDCTGDDKDTITNTKNSNNNNNSSNNNNNYNSHTHGPSDTRISRIGLWTLDFRSLAVSVITGIDKFEVHRVRASRLIPHSASGVVEVFREDGLYIYSNDSHQIDTDADNNDVYDENDNENDNHIGDHNESDRSHEHNLYISSPPDICVQIAVIPKEIKSPNPPGQTEQTEGISGMNGINEDIIIGLSARGKLYCGETLLVAGVSSFAVNVPLEVLMYVSTGTRPLLHFCSFKALRSVDPLKGEAWEDQQQAAAMAGAEPRPVERGARLVLAAPGSPKVILQMPRGNLEAFEPRPLIFLKARELIESKALLSCLLLLRRQKVDLNYLIDYNPIIFLSEVENLVKNALEVNPELLSLLISSLEPGDTTVFKYPVNRPSNAFNNNWREIQLPSLDFFNGMNKVNLVCTAVRDALLRFLNGVQGPRHANALNPALCTYAKQSPPLLVDALALILKDSQLSSLPQDHTPTTTAPTPNEQTKNTQNTQIVSAPTPPLNTTRVHGAIKYLAFLAEGSALFDAALGSCDFDMARAVARQCQMDPKAYLPLLKPYSYDPYLSSISYLLTFFTPKGFEDLGIFGPRSTESPPVEGERWQTAHMHFAVCVHLKRFEDAVEWSTKFFKSVWCNSYTDSGLNSEMEGKDEFLTVIKELFRIVTVEMEGKLFAFTLPRLYSLITQINIESETDHRLRVIKEGGTSPRWVERSCQELLSNIRVSYGAHCLKKLQYTEAISAYLCASPPRALDAVRAARLMGDWQLALMIAGRYGSSSSSSGGGGGLLTDGIDNSELDPKRVAFDIVSAFKESLEQGESGVFDDIGGADQVGLGGEGGDVSVGKALEASQISLDYCNDVETAVSILILSSKYMAAAQVALRTNRRDLLLEEIAPAVRIAAKALIEGLPRRSARQAVLVAELYVTWANPNLRLTQVASTEPTLVAELNGGTLNADGTVWKDKDEDDNKSEFSIASRQSGASYVSTASRSSVRSSASSSVSILSNISIGSSGRRSAVSASAFSIDGLDHSLLSRGTAKGGGSEVGGKREPLRKYKRRQRKVGKGEGGRDLWGLRKEASVCSELWGIAQVSYIAASAKDLCDVLSLFSSDSGDVNLACLLQVSVDEYVKKLQATPPPVAPMYPPQWMEIRLMTTVCRYQEALIPLDHISNIFNINKSDQFQDNNNNNNKNKNDDNDDDNEENNENENEIVLLANKFQYTLIRERKMNSRDDTWWKKAADGILLWRSYRRIILES